MEIFKLFGSILIDSAEAEKSISKTGEKAEGLADKLSGALGSAAKFGSAVVGAATAVGTAMVAAGKSAASTMDTIDKGSQRMGISAEAFQELSYQADLCGVSMTTMEKAAKSLKDGKSFSDAMSEIYALGTAEERAAKASELFGSTVAYQMTPMLNASASDMASMAEEARNLGLVMSDETVKSGANLNDMFAKVEKSLSSLKTQLTAEFMPYLINILQWVIDEMPRIIEAVKTVLDAIMPIVKPALDSVLKAFEIFADLINGDAEELGEDLKAILSALGEAFFELGKDIFNMLWEGIKSVWNGIANWVGEKVNWLAEKVQFWKKGQDEMYADEIDGSHAAGLNYVPYDGYVAELHKGETVLNANASQSMVSDIVNAIQGMNSGGNNSPIELTLNIDGQAFARAMYSYNQAEGKRRGQSLVVV